MITDRETNFVYFADRLPQEHPVFFKKLEGVLKQNGFRYALLHGTKEIWCRDYMPIQVDKRTFVQFKYEPFYLRNSKRGRARITDAKAICEDLGIKPILSDIRLDGGNIIKSRTKIIMTERVFVENSSYSKQELTKEIKKLLKVDKIIVVPQCSADPYGHVDGMVRFIDGRIDEDFLLGNSFVHESKAFLGRFKKVLSEQGLSAMALPYNPHHSKTDIDATGMYINYLQVGKFVIFPVYGKDEDKVAHNMFLSHFGPNVIPIRANEIAQEGGVLNCISWNILK